MTASFLAKVQEIHVKITSLFSLLRFRKGCEKFCIASEILVERYYQIVSTRPFGKSGLTVSIKIALGCRYLDHCVFYS